MWHWQSAFVSGRERRCPPRSTRTQPTAQPKPERISLRRASMPVRRGAPQCAGLARCVLFASVSAGSCPADVPPGVTAMPQCLLRDQTGSQYCALVCDPLSYGECGQGSCQPIQGTGICTYGFVHTSVPTIMTTGDIKCDVCKDALAGAVKSGVGECKKLCKRLGPVDALCEDACNYLNSECMEDKLDCVKKACELIKLCSNETIVV